MILTTFQMNPSEWRSRVVCLWREAERLCCCTRGRGFVGSKFRAGNLVFQMGAKSTTENRGASAKFPTNSLHLFRRWRSGRHVLLRRCWQSVCSSRQFCLGSSFVCELCSRKNKAADFNRFLHCSGGCACLRLPLLGLQIESHCQGLNTWQELRPIWPSSLAEWQKGLPCVVSGTSLSSTSLHSRTHHNISGIVAETSHAFFGRLREISQSEIGHREIDKAPPPPLPLPAHLSMGGQPTHLSTSGLSTHRSTSGLSIHLSTNGEHRRTSRSTDQHVQSSWHPPVRFLSAESILSNDGHCILNSGKDCAGQMSNGSPNAS